MWSDKVLWPQVSYLINLQPSWQPISGYHLYRSWQVCRFCFCFWAPANRHCSIQHSRNGVSFFTVTKLSGLDWHPQCNPNQVCTVSTSLWSITTMPLTVAGRHSNGSRYSLCGETLSVILIGSKLSFHFSPRELATTSVGLCFSCKLWSLHSLAMSQWLGRKYPTLSWCSRLPLRQHKNTHCGTFKIDYCKPGLTRNWWGYAFADCLILP